MKEIIEYLLAALVIISIIPIYNFIMTSYYSPPPKNVEPLTLYTYSQTFNSILYNLNEKGNLTPEVIDITSIFNNALGRNTVINYGYNLSIISHGIKQIKLETNKIVITCRDKGNLSVLIIDSDLSSEEFYVGMPTYEVNGTYFYLIDIDTSNVIAVAAILETGIVRYYDEWISDDVYRMYVINTNNKVTLLIPADYPLPSLYDYHGYDVVDTYIFYYTQLHYFKYRYLWYRYVKDATYYVSYDEPYYKVLIVNESEINYLSTYYSTREINGKLYYLFFPQVFHYEEQYHEEYRRVGDTWRRVTRYLVSSYFDVKQIGFPIYNSVFIILKDTNNRIYIASIYHHRIDLGEKPPVNWPTRTISYFIRIGMVDYLVTITVWRRSM